MLLGAKCKLTVRQGPPASSSAIAASVSGNPTWLGGCAEQIPAASPSSTTVMRGTNPVFFSIFLDDCLAGGCFFGSCFSVDVPAVPFEFGDFCLALTSYPLTCQLSRWPWSLLISVPWSHAVMWSINRRSVRGGHPRRARNLPRSHHKQTQAVARMSATRVVANKSSEASRPITWPPPLTSMASGPRSIAALMDRWRIGLNRKAVSEPISDPSTAVSATE